MSTDDDTPRAIIERVISSDPDNLIDTSVQAWELLASALISIVGEPGFEALFARSAHLVGNKFPWFQVDPLELATDPEFTLLRRRLDGRDFVQARLASTLMLTTFIDTLVSLIGEHMAVIILHTAFGHDSAKTTSEE